MPLDDSAWWAPIGDPELDDALALADLRPGETFVDLGCGDGRVLAAAASRGAHVVGLEFDRDLIRKARARLSCYGSRAVVLERDFMKGIPAADVVFAYLTPTALQRLTPRLRSLSPGTRLVTAWFGVPGWKAAARRGNCFLYRLPAQEPPALPHATPSWSSSGILCLLRPSQGLLVCGELLDVRGPVVVRISPSLAVHAQMRVGATEAPLSGRVAVDLVFRPAATDSVVAGSISAPFAGACRIFGRYHERRWGYWPLAEAATERLEHAFSSVLER